MSELQNNLIDVSFLDNTDVMYLLETLMVYVETFSHGAGWDEDVDDLNHLIDKCSIDNRFMVDSAMQ